MDMDDVKRLNAEALRKAKEALGVEGSQEMNQMLMAYGVAALVAVIAYFLLNHYRPNWVMKDMNGQKQFDVLRAAILSVVAGLVVLLVYHLMYKQQ